MLSSQKKSVESVLDPLVKQLRYVNPNILTLLGSIPPILFFVFVVNHMYIAAMFTFFGNLIDLFDGMIARKYNKVTAFGGFLDSTIDRIADFFIITAFAFSGIVRWELVIPVLLFAFLTSYIRSRGELANPKASFAVGLVERTERLILLAIALLIYAILPEVSLGQYNIAELTFIVIGFLSAVTVGQRVHYAYKHL